MAKITEVVGSVTVRVNVGEYQSVDFFTSMKAVDIRDADMVAISLQDKLVKATLAKLRSHFKARGKHFTDAQICRMYGLNPPSNEREFG